MGPNESWQSDVERELKRINDISINNAINQLALEGQSNYQLPSRIQNTDNFMGMSDLIWIRVTEKVTLDGQYYYSWRRQIKLTTPSGYKWIDVGESGHYSDRPATGVNNENVSVTDGKRYPAKWNPDTSQWIFFLRDYTPPPSGGYHYGIRTWVEWIDRSNLPQLAIPLADDLEKQRVIAGGHIYNYVGGGVKSDHGKTMAYTKINYESYDSFRTSSYSYITPTGAVRAIPGVGAYDQDTAKSYFLYADSSIASNAYPVSTHTESLSNGSTVIQNVKFHWDDQHGSNVTQNIAEGNIHFEWLFLPVTSPSLRIRLSDDSANPGMPAGSQYTSEQLQSLWEALQLGFSCPFFDIGTGSPTPQIATYSDTGLGYPNRAAIIQLAWDMNSWRMEIIHRYSQWSSLYASLICNPGARLSQSWIHNGDYFPGGPNKYGYMKAFGLLQTGLQAGALEITGQNFGTFIRTNDIGVEVMWDDR